ncbi:zinc finger protein 253-like [Toxorhynchites rutilus septentrionalis]|uniref:zinc finger protein 253-like n=1 Tax=Toxorhynchites rutilus septentrionalis TaxID=329112 RepID=UPI00247A3EEF|nr:zinc finger protein 253-like [Toxorhynchites rutilus septentrionalis]
MPVFNLSNFPNVCRICLKTDTTESMLSIDENFVNFECKIVDFLDEITFRVSEKKKYSLPTAICSPCLEKLTDFIAYRNNLVLALRFMEAFVDLKESNTESMSTLFEHNKRELHSLFDNLSLCNKTEPNLEDLLAEFEQYEFACYEEGIDIKSEAIDLVTANEDHTTFDDRDIIEDQKYVDGDDHYTNDTKENIQAEIIYVKPFDEDDSAGKNTENDQVRNRRQTLRKTRDLPKEYNRKATATKRRGRPRVHPDGSFLKEPWSCDKCKFKTKYRIAVDRHKAVHVKRENRTYPCSECEQVFRSYDEMRSHSLSHPENQVVCEICGTALRNSYSLKAHMERHEDSKKYTCEYCDYASNTKLSLKAHMSIHTKDNWNKRCEVCGVIFRTSSRLKRHMESHSNERKYACEQCPGRFNTTNALRNHYIRVHMAIRHACEHCDKSYDQKIALRDHIERVHHIQCNFVCDICVITYDSQDKLETHKLRHANPKPLECNVCLSLHLNQIDFDKHMCITYRNDYQCCDKDLRNHFQYNKHMLVKHGVKTNVRVKPPPGVLLGQLRGARKRLEQCRKCDIAFPSRALKLQHMAICNKTQISPVETNTDNVSDY